jgi:hypothetical protein
MAVQYSAHSTQLKWKEGDQETELRPNATLGHTATVAALTLSL